MAKSLDNSDSFPGVIRPQNRHTSPWWTLFIPCLPIVAVYLLHVRRFNFLCDDAFISFRYARNLADGLGLRFNPGECPPVEGFSNLLWVLLMSIVEFLSASPGVWSRVVSVASGIALILCLFHYLRVRLLLPLGAVFVATTFFVMLPPVAVWSTGGLATIPFTLLVFLAYVLLVGTPSRARTVPASLVGLGIVLIRTEGIVWALLVGVLAIAELVLQRRHDHLRKVWPYFAIIMSAFALHLLWRFLYFDQIIPNTVHAKMGFSALGLRRGWNYSFSFLLSIPSIPLVGLASLWLLRWPPKGPGMTAALMVAATFTAAFLQGGDFMPFFRFMVVGLPFLAVLFAYSLSRMWGDAPARISGVAILVLACVVLSVLPGYNRHPVPESWRIPFGFRQHPGAGESKQASLNEYDRWAATRRLCVARARIGRALKEIARPGESIVRVAIGAVGYYSNLRILDRGGLVSPEVARRPALFGQYSPGHDKVVPLSFFEELRPTYVYASLHRLTPALRRKLEIPKERKIEPYEFRRFREGVFPAAHNHYLETPENRHLLNLYRPLVVGLPLEHGSTVEVVMILGKRREP